MWATLGAISSPLPPYLRNSHNGHGEHLKPFVKHLFQNFIGEVEAVHVLEGVAAFAIREIFIGGLQYPEVAAVFFGMVGVFAKEDAVLVFFEETIGHSGLAPQFSDDGSEFLIHVEELIHEAVEAGQVVGKPGR